MLFNKIILTLLTSKYKWNEIMNLSPIDPSSITNNFLMTNWKHETFPKMYLNGVLLSPHFDFEGKIYLECLYVKAKKTLDAFTMLAKIFKLKKAVKYSNNEDLYLNSLDDFKSHHKISIYENKTLYNFRLSNLVNYWVECLYNSEGLFPAPLVLRNPYTNIEFSKHNLYNIYFKLLETKFTIPVCIVDFFKNDMDKELFLIVHYTQCQEETLKNFMKNNSITEKFEQILNMLHEYRKDIDYLTFGHINSIDLQKKAFDFFKGCLFLYLKGKYSCNPLIKRASNIKCRDELISLLKYNKDFGFEGEEIIRYVPYNERVARTHPPPPPPNVRNRARTRRRRNILFSSSLPPPPPPPISLTNVVTNNPLNVVSEILGSSDEEEIPIHPIHVESNDEDTETPVQQTTSSTTNTLPQQSELQSNTPQNSIRSTLNFNTTQRNSNIMNLMSNNIISPFRPMHEIPRSPSSNRVIRTSNFSLFN